MKPSFIVRIQPNEECYHEQKNTQFELGKKITRLFGGKATADVAFEVGGTIFYAHRLILKVQAHELLELAEEYDVDTPMPVNDVDPKIFEIMLKHVYGMDILPCEWKDQSKQILVASGKYGFSELRSEAEAMHIRSFSFTVNNAVDELLYADGTHCLVLKKAVIKFIVENAQAVIASPAFPKLSESAELMTEVMMELAKSNESKK